MWGMVPSYQTTHKKNRMAALKNLKITRKKFRGKHAQTFICKKLLRFETFCTFYVFVTPPPSTSGQSVPIPRHSQTRAKIADLVSLET